jgi:ABC-type bacteriocin/lantibiotic exporter with double-glycine peptidase domain
MKAKGWFFSDVETWPYEARGVVIGQGRADSCVAACCRMLLSDHGIEQPEAFIRAALKLEEGAFLSDAPRVLAEFGLNVSYQYRRDLTVDGLKKAVAEAAVIAYVSKPGQRAGHAVLIEEITDQAVAVCDPLPEGEGRAYRLSLTDFLSCWLTLETGLGCAVVMLD